jgi:hypothetical protein
MEDGAAGNAESPESRFSDLAEPDDAFTALARNQPVLASRGNMPNSKCHHRTLTLFHKRVLRTGRILPISPFASGLRPVSFFAILWDF